MINKTEKSFYWTTSACGKTLFVIAPFGYGPKIAANTFASSNDISLLKWKMSDSFLFDKSYQKLVNFGVTEIEFYAEYKIWVDCLLWFRNDLGSVLEKYDLILAENFFPIPEKYQTNNKVEIIPPLTNFKKNGNDTINSIKGNYVLSIGGVETPFTTDFHRYFIAKYVINSFAEVLKETNNKLIVCCPDHISFKLSKMVVDHYDTVEYRTLKHWDYLKLIENAKALILQPGLYGPFEAFYKEIPTYLLTPTSYTQLRQAMSYKENDLIKDIPFLDPMIEATNHFKGNILKEESECFK